MPKTKMREFSRFLDPKPSCRKFSHFLDLLTCSVFLGSCASTSAFMRRRRYGMMRSRRTTAHLYAVLACIYVTFSWFSFLVPFRSQHINYCAGTMTLERPPHICTSCLLANVQCLLLFLDSTQIALIYCFKIDVCRSCIISNNTN